MISVLVLVLGVTHGERCIPAVSIPCTVAMQCRGKEIEWHVRSILDDHDLLRGWPTTCSIRIKSLRAALIVRGVRHEWDCIQGQHLLIRLVNRHRFGVLVPFHRCSDLLGE